MKLSRMLAYQALALAPIALVLAACGRRSDVTVNNLPEDTTGILVAGEGTVDAPPDTGTFTIGVSVQSPTVAEARTGAAEAASAVIASLKDNGIAAEDIQTVNLSIQPVYDYQTGREPRIIAYQVSNTVNVKVRDLDVFSKAVDDAVAAGGDATRLQSIGFTVEDDDEFLAQARQRAVEDARTKADQLASAAGVKLGTAQSISEQQQGATPVFLEADALRSAQSSTSTPIEAGTNTIRVSVSIRYAIER